MARGRVATPAGLRQHLGAAPRADGADCHDSLDREYRPHYDAYDLAQPRGQFVCRFGHQRIATVLRVNRVRRLFAQAFASVQRLGDQASNLCFTSWDTYSGRHLEPA